MNIKETFIELTKETYPHGHETELFDKLPKNLEKDEFGNLFIQIGENPSCMFTSHLDTASRDKVFVNHIFDGNYIKTDGSSILGADDKAGVTIMLYMIEKEVKGLYYFFLGEERGCIGSKKLAQKWKENKPLNIKKVISFDRRGLNSIITHQSSQRCCSNDFAKQLAGEFNNLESGFSYELDPTGIYTDSYQFFKIIPECTNISVGYYSEHTKSEKQDLDHLEKLANVCIKVNWENLIVSRDESEIEEDYYDRWEYNYYKPKKEQNIRKWFIDKEFDNYISLVETDKRGKIVKYDVNKKRIEFEKSEIQKFFDKLQLKIEKFEWNGIFLKSWYKNQGSLFSNITERKELEEYIDILNLSKVYKSNIS